MNCLAGPLFGVLLAFASFQAGNAQSLVLNDEEIAAALSHGPWPAPDKNDPSNRVSGNPAAIKLGKTLFFSQKLSADGTLSCASCHRPESGFTDRLPQAMGHTRGDRNTQSLFNLKHHRWFGWAGSNDNLWAQSLRPVVRSDEMALPATNLDRVLSEEEFHDAYTALFGSAADFDSEHNLVNVGKLLAAFIETLTTGKTPFDLFRDALAVGDQQAAASYPEAAQRGFRIFAGKGNCSFCHTGPLFSNGEFHDAGVPYFV
ncbi:MAG: cytochrome c peroxidase, partial [Pseudomonadota bacterium]